MFGQIGSANLARLEEMFNDKRIWMQLRRGTSETNLLDRSANIHDSNVSRSESLCQSFVSAPCHRFLSYRCYSTLGVRMNNVFLVAQFCRSTVPCVFEEAA